MAATLRRGIIVTAVLALLAALYPPAPARAQNATPHVGVQFHATWSDYTPAQRLEVLDRLAAAGATWVRVDLGWASFEEDCAGCVSQWYVDLTRSVVSAARERGISVLGTFWRTPSWAGDRGPTAPPHRAEDYARAAAWAANEFAGEIDHWEIWNEPNDPAYFDGTVDQYVALLRAAYPAIKAANPAATVVLGGPVHNDTSWLRQMYDAGGGGSFDVMATHPYLGPADAAPETPDPSGTEHWLLTHVEAVRRLMVERGDGAKPIWFTELGWSSHANVPGLPNWKRGVDEATQADYLVRTIDLVQREYPYVTHLFWYNERDRSSGDTHLDGYGLLRRDLTPKPAYFAMQARLTGGPAGVAAPRTSKRISGGDRIETAIALSRYAHPDGADTAVVATGGTFPDALAAGPLAAAAGGPVLLNRGDVLDPRVREELVRLRVRTVYLLGGTAVQSAAVEHQLAELADVRVQRVAGEDRYATAAAAAELATQLWRRAGHHDAGAKPLIALGSDFPDALATVPLAAVRHQPVLLITSHAVPEATSRGLSRLGAVGATVIGGPNAVSEAARGQLGVPSDRLAGSDRYETAAMAATATVREGGDGAAIVLATGQGFADALAAGPTAANDGGVLLLVPNDGAVPGPAEAFLREHADPDRPPVVAGGPRVVSDHVLSGVARASAS